MLFKNYTLKLFLSWFEDVDVKFLIYHTDFNVLYSLCICIKKYLRFEKINLVKICIHECVKNNIVLNIINLYVHFFSFQYLFFLCITNITTCLVLENAEVVWYVCGAKYLVKVHWSTKGSQRIDKINTPSLCETICLLVEGCTWSPFTPPPDLFFALWTLYRRYCYNCYIHCAHTSSYFNTCFLFDM